ncbi:MAG: methyltransferase domain-containing protein [Chloroflexi bacterium]|nr:methyltransferase domain-containing protein [Chloroflexota bacterium]
MLTALHRVRRSLPMRERADLDELLDGGGLTAGEIDANLRDLARLNRLPGGTAESANGIRRLLPDPKAERINLVDVGTGSGDMPAAFARHGWWTTAVDTNPAVLRVARRRTRTEQRVRVVESDARSLPFADDVLEVAHCSLLVHHLDPAEAVAVLREMARVARHGVVVNDLRRGMAPLAITALTVTALGRSRVTRSDGVASARRAYTLSELDDLLAEAGLRVAWRSAAWMPRVVTAAVRR